MKPETSASLLITSGAGPAECNQAIAKVLDRMKREADALGVGLDISETPAKHGPKSAIVVVHGVASRVFTQRWCGTIRWRARSELRPNCKRANWFIGVFELAPDPAGRTEISPSDVSFESFRAGGPGGQHQNKVDSAVRAVHLPTGLATVVRQTRSQHRNKALALKRLQGLLVARSAAADAERKYKQSQLHNELERGNPVRRFKGGAFREEGI